MTRAPRKGSQGITIRDVAERAGVSAMTVSNVLNGRGAMSERTKRHVLMTIEALGYAPNEAARTLARAQATKIGFLQPSRHNAFLSSVLVGALRACGQAGAQLLLRGTTDRTFATLSTTVDALTASGVTGILTTPPVAEMFGAGELPLPEGVSVGAVAPGRPLDGLVTVRIDDRAAAAAMVDRLFARGYSRIALVMGPDEHSSAAARTAGYLDALARRNVPVDPRLVVQGTFEAETSVDAVRTLFALDPRPDAIFASNDNMAAVAIQIALQTGVRVPEELGVAGFDDAEIASRLWPTLTTVRLPVEEMAHRCVTELIQRTPDKPAASDQLLDFEIVERGSTRPASTFDD